MTNANRKSVLSILLAFGLHLSSCGPKGIQGIEAPSFAYSSQFVGAIGLCPAVLFGENRILFHEKCLGENAWFKLENEFRSYAIVERTDTNPGLSFATLATPVSPWYATLYNDDSGWNSRNVVAYVEFGAAADKCEAMRDGSHTCECPEESHPVLIHNGYLIGIVERCKTLESSGIYIPAYILGAISGNKGDQKIITLGKAIK